MLISPWLIKIVYFGSFVYVLFAKTADCVLVTLTLGESIATLSES